MSENFSSTAESFINEPTPDGMIWIPGGTFQMGSNHHYPEEAPVRRVSVDSFWIDRTPVTNKQFREFVEATGYVTFAEVPPRAEDYPGAQAAMLKAGSLMFEKPCGPVDLRFVTWWTYRFGADWMHPEGPGSSIDGRDDHPVVHVTYKDAHAYALWRGREIPTEAEWEFAARAKYDGAEYSWGAELTPDGKTMANTWQGNFPMQNLLEDGWEATSPVEAFPPNRYGIYDMIGNTWEWTSDWYGERAKAKDCCLPKNPRGVEEDASHDPCVPELRIPRKVLKGGSFLCAPNYCRRYRPAARIPEPIDTSTNHLGFRCIKRPLRK
ncbi:MAG TPA: formylglycine-generating enzyme family protein [Bdellovibrionales bacterium]|jgi:formylglycine-generating enzyme required for sulfatase activity|nr:formylglycine-generating enzyme family protein [Bdellovibrionales bacterium]